MPRERIEHTEHSSAKAFLDLLAEPVHVGAILVSPTKDVPSGQSLIVSIVMPPAFVFWTWVTTFPPILSSSSFRFSGEPRSGNRLAISAPLHDGNGRLAGQM
jgi:hypothetical protein